MCLCRGSLALRHSTIDWFVAAQEPGLLSKNEGGAGRRSRQGKERRSQEPEKFARRPVVANHGVHDDAVQNPLEHVGVRRM